MTVRYSIYPTSDILYSEGLITNYGGNLTILEYKPTHTRTKSDHVLKTKPAINFLHPSKATVNQIMSLKCCLEIQN